jgi:hypothetical protein
MKTWKQGVIGKIIFEENIFVFLKCLQYPLEIFYKNIEEISDKNTAPLFYAFIDLSVFKYIERVGFEKISKEDKLLNSNFTIDFNTLEIKILPSKINTYKKYSTLRISNSSIEDLNGIRIKYNKNK